MKKRLLLILLPLLLLLGGCGLGSVNVETTADPADYSYVYTPDTEPRTTAAEETATLPSETQSAAPATETATGTTAAYTVTTLPLPTESAAPSTSAPGTTAAPETVTVPPSTAEGEIDLSIQLPEANGKMEVSTDPGNVFISAVRSARGIDPSLLAAVYSVPESGQNYVFEFKSAERSAENLRRVYLLQADGAILSVAASNSAERENLSATENWFCMNVLIKNMVFPAVKDQM